MKLQISTHFPLLKNKKNPFSINKTLMKTKIQYFFFIHYNAIIYENRTRRVLIAGFCVCVCVCVRERERERERERDARVFYWVRKKIFC